MSDFHAPPGPLYAASGRLRASSSRRSGMLAQMLGEKCTVGVHFSPSVWFWADLRLRCFRAIDTLTALSIHLELGGDWARFEKPQRLGAWLGMTPSLNQSGESSASGSITKTGSTLARRLLVEAAWHYAPRPYVGPTLQERQAGQPDHILAISNKAQHRLHHVYHQMNARGKPHGVVTVAVARELACFLWATATAD